VFWYSSARLRAFARFAKWLIRPLLYYCQQIVACPSSKRFVKALRIGLSSFIQIYLVPDRAIKGKSQKKYWKIIRFEQNLSSLKTPTHWRFSFFWIRVVLGFLKRNRFLFFKTTQKPHSELLLLHHAISPFLELHNNNLLYLLWHSNSGVKKCT